MMSILLQNEANTALDEKMRGYWLIGTSALTEQEISGVRVITLMGNGLSDVRNAIHQTDNRCEKETGNSR